MISSCNFNLAKRTLATAGVTNAVERPLWN